MGRLKAMKRATRFLATILLLLTAVPAFAVEKSAGPVSYELSGYFKKLLMLSDAHGLYEDLQVSDKRFLFDDFNRLRLKNKLSLGEYFELVCHYEGFISNGDSQIITGRSQRLTARALAFSPTLAQDPTFAALAGSLAPTPAPRFMDLEEEARIGDGGQRMAHGIDRLFLKFQSDWVELAVGRMALSWGTGRLFNPTDMWSPFSATEIDKDEKRGVDLVYASLNLPLEMGLEAVYAPLSFDDEYEIKNEESAVGGRLRFNVGEYDFSAMGGYFNGDYVTGGDFSGYLWNAGFRGEGSYTFVDPEDQERDYLRAVVSLDYGFAVAWNPYLLGEYFYNGLGEPDSDDYLERYSDASVARMAMLGRSFNIGQNYLAMTGRIQPHALVTTNLTPIVNVNDGSFVTSMSVIYAVTDYADLIAGANVFGGGPGTEFGGLEIDFMEKIHLDVPDQYYLYLKAFF
jgi:hypothetical protein